MFRKRINVISAAFLISTAIGLSGCSSSPEPSVAVKTSNTNLSPTALSNGNTTVGNAVSANGNTSAVLPNGSASPANNGSAAAAGKDKTPTPAVNEPKPQIGSGGNDFALFAQIRGALNAEKEFETVIVEIKEGNVVLTGNVSSEAQKTKAQQMVQTVKGVKSVKNNLRVAS